MKKSGIIFWPLLIFFMVLAFFFGYKYYYKNYYLPTNIHTVSKFSIADLKDEKLYYNASKEYIISILGEPINESISVNEESIDNTNILFYNGCRAYFSDNKLNALYLSSSDYSFKGIHVGDDANKVIETFYREDFKNEDNYAYSSDEKIIGKYLYGNFNIYNLDSVKTKEAIFYAYETSLKSYNNIYSINFVYMCPPYINEYASIQDNSTYLTFVIENDKVSSICWDASKTDK